MIEIRRLDAGEAAAYREIRLQALALDPDAFGSTLATEQDWPMARFEERVASTTVLGAFAGPRMVGMAGLYRPQGAKAAHKAVLWGVFVHPDARGQGIGQALIQAAIAAAGPGVEQLTLDAITDNQAAIRLYQRCGFTIYGVEQRALKAGGRYFDTALMARRLGEQP